MTEGKPAAGPPAGRSPGPALRRIAPFAVPIGGALALLGLAVGCVAPRWRESHEVAPDYASARPVMIAIRVEGPDGLAAALTKALHARLLALDYSPLAPGATPSPETGFLRVRLEGTEILPKAVIRLEDPAGKLLFRARVTGYRGDMEGLANALTRSLPPKDAPAK